jgi:hypothetical protein
MRISKVISMSFVVAMMVGVLVAVAGASSAFGESPWWQLTSGSRPSYLHAGVGTPGTLREEEVQEMLVSTEEFSGHPEQSGLSLAVTEEPLGEFGTEPLAGEFGFTPLSAARLQSAPQAPYGGGNVTVKRRCWLANT